jgi:hypothetical protein
MSALEGPSYNRMEYLMFLLQHFPLFLHDSLAARDLISRRPNYFEQKCPPKIVLIDSHTIFSSAELPFSPYTRWLNTVHCVKRYKYSIPMVLNPFFAYPQMQFLFNFVTPNLLVYNSSYTPSVIFKTKNKLRGLSPRANYTDLATAACRRS